MKRDRLWPTATKADSASTARLTCDRTRPWKSNPGMTLTDAVRLADAGLPLGTLAPHLSHAGKANPNWVETLMGFPENWTDSSTSSGKWHGFPATANQGQYAWEPPRVAEALNRPKRLKALGNAVVPQCAEFAINKLMGDKSPVTIGSLFSGIGGIELGIETALPGSKTVWQVEREKFCRDILAVRWPGSKLYDDVRTFALEGGSEIESVDMICLGFPCTSISSAGKGAGIHGKESNLWFEGLRCISTLKPKYVLIENVSTLRSRGLDTVIDGLDKAGYDSKWISVRANVDVGATHRRHRVFILATKR